MAEKDGSTERRIVELEGALARERRISRALREVGSALGATLDLDDLLELVLDRVTELVGAERATLYLLDEDTKDLVSRVVSGGEVESIRVKIGHGIAGAVAETGRPIRVANAYDDGRFEPEWDALTGYATKSILAVPLKNHLGRAIGVVQALNKRDGEQFTEEDEALVTALSTQAAIAIVNSRLFLSLIQKNTELMGATEQLERNVKDLQLLFDLERATAHATSMEELVRAALGEAMASCGAAGAAMLLSDRETGDLVQYVVAAGDDAVERFGVRSKVGLLGAAMKQDGTVEVTDVSGDPRISDQVEGRYPFEVRGAVAVPLQGEEDAAFGAIGLFSKKDDRPFSAEDGALLRLVSANVSTAIRLLLANQERERSERLTTIGRLLSGVIHDFKTPMTVISGYVQLMQHADDAEKRAEFVEEILAQFDVLTAMQREVLEFARGEKTIFIRKVYLKKFFAEISRQLGQLVDGRAVEIELDIDTKVTARFDESRVARAIHNLTRNAVEAMAERGGKLTVSAGMESKDLVIRVTDSGPGIPAEIEDSLFQSFVTAGKKGGTGLGLAIVKKIVEEHGGSIGVTSSPSGATFEMRFPQAGPEEKSGPGPRPARRRRSPDRPTAKTGG